MGSSTIRNATTVLEVARMDPFKRAENINKYYVSARACV